jgi:putative ABC transport system ATP-binding protein
MSVIRAHEISVVESGTTLVDRTNLAIDKGLTVLTGPSGSGKSTLVNVLFGINKPTTGLVEHLDDSGDVVYVNEPARKRRLGESILQRIFLETREERRASEYRRRNLGYIAQHPFIPPHLEVDRYIDLVRTSLGTPPNQPLEHAIYDGLRVSEDKFKTTSELSGGEAQRFAIAFAFAHQPRLVVADEPTSDLDSVSTERALQMFQGITRTGNISMLMVSHDPAAVEVADTVIEMKDGRIEDVQKRRG